MQYYALMHKCLVVISATLKLDFYNRSLKYVYGEVASNSYATVTSVEWT